MNIQEINQEANKQLWQDIQGFSHYKNPINKYETEEIRFLCFGDYNISYFAEVLMTLDLNYTILSTTLILTTKSYDKLAKFLSSGITK